MCYTEEATLSHHYHPESIVYTGIHPWYGTSVGLDTYIRICIPHYGFPGGSVLKSWPGKQATWVQSLDQEDPLEKEMAIFWSGKSHGQRSLAGYSTWGRKESDTIEQLKSSNSSIPPYTTNII